MMRLPFIKLLTYLLTYRLWKECDGIYVRLDRIPQRDGRTDGRKW